MTARLATTNTPTSVHHKHALLTPRLQKTTSRHITTNIIHELFEYILQTWRQFHSWLNRKTHTMCLPWPVIRVLPNDYYFYSVQRASSETWKHILTWRINIKSITLRINPIHQCPKIRLLSLILNKLPPGCKLHTLIKPRLVQRDNRYAATHYIAISAHLCSA